MPILRQLNLTDAQREQIKALTDEHRAQDDTQSPARKLVELQRTLEAAVFADTPDNAQIEQLRASIAEAEAATLAARVDLQLKIAQILTPEQRKQARELMDRRPGRSGRAGGPRGVRLRGKPARNTPVTGPTYDPVVSLGRQLTHDRAEPPAERWQIRGWSCVP